MMEGHGMSKKKKELVFNELISSLGKDNVSINTALACGYRGTNYNVMQPWGKRPELVVMPKVVKDVQETLRIANQERITVLPISCGTITAFMGADIVMDMLAMDKILEIDTENSYVLVEPGVTYNTLMPLLRKEGYTIAIGSFPPNFTVLGNLGIRRGFNHNFSSRFADQTLGLEIVMADGTLLRTGTATLDLPFWSQQSNAIPDIRGLFVPVNQRNPMLGVITKGALRIWPIMEAAGLPIGGFDNYAKAMKFCKAVAKAGIADQSMVWNWVLVGMSESRKRGGKEDLDFLSYRMTADYTKPYKGLHYCYTWTQFRGYKEQVETNLKLCKRIAKEMGGKILTDQELEETIPNMWKSWKLTYQEFKPEETAGGHAWKVGGEGVMDVWYYTGWIDDLIRLEQGYNQRLKQKYHWPTQPYYCRVFESGIGGHLRYMPPNDMADDYQAKKLLKMREDMHTWVIDNYPTTYTPGGYKRVKTHSIGMGAMLDKIKNVLDPNHIMYMPGEKRLEPDDELKQPDNSALNN